MVISGLFENLLYDYAPIESFLNSFALFIWPQSVIYFRIKKVNVYMRINLVKLKVANRILAF